MGDLRGVGRPPSHPAPQAPPVDPPRTPALQLVASGVLGVVLLGAGLWMWRRPRAIVDVDAVDAGMLAGVLPESQGVGASEGGATGSGSWKGAVRVSEPRVVGCHDRGSKKTPPDECDHPAAFERALSNAIEQAATCVPIGRSDATIEYVADLSFPRHLLRIDLPRAGRSVRDRAVVDACAAAVRLSLPTSTLDGVEHRHARYKISMTATYRGGG